MSILEAVLFGGVIIGLIIVVTLLWQQVNELSQTVEALYSGSGGDIARTLDKHGKDITRLLQRSTGQANMIENLNSHGAILASEIVRLDAAMVVDCEDCEDDDEPTPILETVRASGDIGSTGDDPSHVLEGEGRADVRGDAVDVPGVLGDREGEGGTSTSMMSRYDDWGLPIRLTGIR